MEEQARCCRHTLVYPEEEYEFGATCLILYRNFVYKSTTWEKPPSAIESDLKGEGAGNFYHPFRNIFFFNRSSRVMLTIHRDCWRKLFVDFCPGFNAFCRLE